MAPRGKLKTENGRYKYPFFFSIRESFIPTRYKKLEFNFDADSWTWPHKTTCTHEQGSEPVFMLLFQSIPLQTPGGSQPKDL